MKKYLVLTSILALTACAGGSGGHGGAGGGESGSLTGVGDVIVKPVYPDGVEPKVSDDAVASNAKITTIVSEVVEEDTSSSKRFAKINAARAATVTSTTDGATYIRSNLNDVNFIMSDEGFGGEFIFNVKDDGEISGITKFEDEDDDNLVFEREDKTNRFRGEVVGEADEEDKCDGGTDGECQGDKKIPAILTFESYAKKHNVKLRYSDFGIFDIKDTENGNQMQDAIFIGGYNDESRKKIDIANVVGGEMTFNGVAVGSVVAVHKGSDYEWEDDTSLSPEGAGILRLLDKDAKLEFDPTEKTQTLTAKFENWYNITYTKDVSSDTAGKVEFKKHEDFTNKDFYLLDGKTELSVTGEEFRYYGDNGKPSEAVGMIQIRDCANGICTDDNSNSAFTDEIRMNLGFGGTK